MSGSERRGLVPISSAERSSNTVLLLTLRAVDTYIEMKPLLKLNVQSCRIV